MKLRLTFLASLIALALNVSAQVTLEGYGEIIQTAVANSFPPSTGLTAALGQIPDAVNNRVGERGNAIVRGRSASGDLLGDGLTGSTTSSSNIDISSGIVINQCHMDQHDCMETGRRS